MHAMMESTRHDEADTIVTDNPMTHRNESCHLPNADRARCSTFKTFRPNDPRMSYSHQTILVRAMMVQ